MAENRRLNLIERIIGRWSPRDRNLVAITAGIGLGCLAITGLNYWSQKQAERHELLQQIEMQSEAQKADSAQSELGSEARIPTQGELYPAEYDALKNSAINPSRPNANNFDYAPGMNIKTESERKTPQTQAKQAGYPVSERTKKVKNNNPGNIKAIPGKPWAGQTGVDSRGFAVFKNETYGVRATIKNLIDYNTVYGDSTIREIVGRYAPKEENNTNRYILNLSKMTGYHPDEKIDLKDKRIAAELAHKIFFLESSAVYSGRTIENAIAMLR